MGSYLFKIKPSEVIRVEGLSEDYLVHNSHFAYKPWSEWGYNGEEGEKANRRLDFTTGIIACNAAWKRKGTRPEFVGRFPKDPKHYAEVNIYLYPKSGDPGCYNDDALDCSDHLVGTAIFYPDSLSPGKWVMRYRQLDASEWHERLALAMSKRAVEKE